MSILLLAAVSEYNNIVMEDIIYNIVVKDFNGLKSDKKNIYSKWQELPPGVTQEPNNRTPTNPKNCNFCNSFISFIVFLFGCGSKNIKTS